LPGIKRSFKKRGLFLAYRQLKNNFLNFRVAGREGGYFPGGLEHVFMLSRRGGCPGFIQPFPALLFFCLPGALRLRHFLHLVAIRLSGWVKK
jgi:hypothetical protein